VSLSEERIWTPNDVDFRLGPHFGTRRTAARSSSFRASRAGQQGVNVGGIDSFQLERLDRLHLLRPTELAAGRTSRKSRPAAAASRPGPFPFEITCRGPFRFNLGQQVATFRGSRFKRAALFFPAGSATRSTPRCWPCSSHGGNRATPDNAKVGAGRRPTVSRNARHGCLRRIEARGKPR